MNRGEVVHWTKDEVAQMVQMCNEGATKSEVAESLGVPLSRVRAKAKSMGLSFRREGSWTKDDEKWLVSLAECGLSADRISDVMHKSYGSIIAKSVRLGIQLGLGYKDGRDAENARVRWRSEEDLELEKNVKNGLTVEQCAMKMSRSRSSIRNRAHVLGLKVKNSNTRG